MSPDPTQQPIEASLNAPNLQFDARGVNESDSEDDDVGMSGYEPLSQVPLDSDPMLYDDEDDEWVPNNGENSQTLSLTLESHHVRIHIDLYKNSITVLDLHGFVLHGLLEVNQKTSSYILTYVREAKRDCLSETIEVWSSPHNRSNIDMDADKINQVKSMMASFTLPTTAIPEWANTISEDQWKEQLIGRIKEIQNREK